MKSFWIVLLFALALVGGVLAGTQLIGPSTSALDENVTRLNNPRALPAFDLVNAKGEAVTPETLRGQWNLLFFGFTYCPDICPTTLAEMAALAEQNPELMAQVQPVFVSVDPRRDSPEKMRSYTEFFDPDILAITTPDGSEAEITKLTSAVGIPHAKIPQDDSVSREASIAAGNYTVDHSASMVVLDPQARVAAYISPPQNPELLARNLRALIKLAEAG